MALAFSAVKGGVTTPRGFRAAGISAGIKANKGLDLALLVSESPATAAAVFTVNRAQAAPVVAAGLERGVIVNRTADTVVRLLPPLVITEAEADEALGRLDAALTAFGAAA